MNQKTIYKQGKVCGNKKFRYCDVGVDTHQCVNCGYFFGEELHAGDHIIGKCDDCEKKDIEIIVEYKLISYNKETGKHDGEQTPYGKCVECSGNTEAIEKLYDPFRSGDYGRDSEGNFSNERYVQEREDAISEIVKLPESQLKTFLRGVFDVIER